MIQTICKRLMRYHPTIPILTIHDSILTPVSKAEKVREIMKQEFDKVGMNPQFHFDELRPELFDLPRERHNEQN